MKNLEDEEENKESAATQQLKQSQVTPQNNTENVANSEYTIVQSKNSKTKHLTNDERLIMLLKKQNRSLNELIQIEHLTQDLKFFEQINKDVTNQKGHLHRKICKYLKFDYRPRGRVVFYQGDFADSFFIVLQGKCLVLISNKDSNPPLLSQQTQAFNSPIAAQSPMNFSNAHASFLIENKKQVASPMGVASRKRFSIFQKGQITSTLQSVQKILRWRLFHKIVWLVIYANRYIRHSQGRELDISDQSTPGFLQKLYRMVGQKSYMNERYQRLRKDIQQNVHQEIDLQYLENAPHFFEKYNNQNFLYQAIKVYKKGESFGELGLLSRKPRSATVICLTDCVFTSLSKLHYSKTLQEVEQNQIDKRIGFLFQTFLPQQLKVNNNIKDKKEEDDDDEEKISSGQNIPNNSGKDFTSPRDGLKIDKQLLSYSESKLNKIQLYFTKTKFTAGKVLQKQGEPIDKLYIIKKGEVCCQLTIQSQQNPQKTQTINLSILGRYEIIGDEIMIKSAINKKKKQQIDQADENQEKQKNISEDQINQEMVNPSEQVQTTQSTQFFESKTSFYTAVVKSSQCSVLVITKNDFRRMVYEFPDVKKYLKIKAETKIQWMEQRKNEQIQVIKKLDQYQQRMRLNDEQQQIIEDNPHLARKKQFKRMKMKSNDSGLLKKSDLVNIQSSKRQSLLNSNEIMSLQNTYSPSKSPQTNNIKQLPIENKVQRSKMLTRKNSKEIQLTQMMMTYFSKEMKNGEQRVKNNIIDHHQQDGTTTITQEKMISDALAIKYGYNPSSLSNQKLRPSQIIDFIFNHQENEQDLQQEQIMKLSGNQYDQEKLLSGSPEKGKNQDNPKDGKGSGYKIDYSTLGYSDNLIKNIIRRKTMKDMMMMQEKEGEQNQQNLMNQKQLSNSIEKSKKKLHITHDAFQLRLINKMNKNILKSTQDTQKSQAFYSQSKEVFINNLASSSKSSVVSPLRYKYMFNSKIPKKKEFEKLFNKTIHSPKNKGTVLRKQQSMQSMLENNSNRSRIKSSVHSNMSTESISPTNKQQLSYRKSPSFHQLSQKSPKTEKVKKSSSIHSSSVQQSPASKQESQLNNNSPFDFSSCIIQTQLRSQQTLQKKKSLPSMIDNSPRKLKKLDSITLQDTFSGTKQDQQELSHKLTSQSNNMTMTPLNASRSSFSKLSKIVQSPNKPSQLSMEIKNITSNTSMPSIQNTQFIDYNNNESNSAYIKQNSLSSVLSAKLPNYNQSLFRQASVEQKKRFTDILSKVYSIQSGSTSSQSTTTVTPPIKNKEINIHVQQIKNYQMLSKSNVLSSPNKFSPTKKYSKETYPSKKLSLSQIDDQSQTLGLLIQSSSSQQPQHQPKSCEKQLESGKAKKSVFSMQALQNTSQNLKDTATSADKIVVLNHMGKPVNYYLSQPQNQSSLTHLDNISQSPSKQIQYCYSPHIYQHIQKPYSQIIPTNKNAGLIDMQTSTSYDLSIPLSPPVPKSAEFDTNLLQTLTINSAKSYQKSNYNFNPIFNPNIYIKK